MWGKNGVGWNSEVRGGGAEGDQRISCRNDFFGVWGG